MKNPGKWLKQNKELLKMALCDGHWGAGEAIKRHGDSPALLTQVKRLEKYRQDCLVAQKELNDL